MIRILLADDHEVVRRGMKQMLEEEEDITVVGEGANGSEILKLLEAGTEADVLLTDLSMPAMGGLELAKEMSQKFPTIKIILLTIQEEDTHVQQAFQAGIKSYIFKTAEAEEVLFAIRQAERNQPYLCADLCKKIIRRMVRSADVGVKDSSAIDFSEREMEVLQLIAAGYTNEEVADRLFTSRRTVESHRQSMLDKTGSRNSLALIAHAMRQGLLT